ncbi:NECAP-like protein CG9132 isoform X2 [Sitodiplosis mosellana]|uniref:NECAP-like protein CG9132 isoform X2 n=1 Tax=Sitodiplosis mosellana TaxID=263140 RepID=UPI0024443DF0|nr:NECAP-like protein CG9132 isoform X2 [Sitodiplosis mosellana]
MDDHESILLIKQEVFVYKIPPAGSNRKHRAANWNLSEPLWTGRMKLVAKGINVNLKLEDKNTGALYANCPVETYPGVAIEAVSDSSRYFVIRVVDDNGRTAFLGLGFGDRSDSFDLNVALQDHFKWVKNQEKIDQEKVTPRPELDLGFKEGETIKINMKITKKDGSESSRRTRTGATGAFPPPPGGIKLAPPPSNPTEPSSNNSQSTPQPQASPKANANWVQF